MLGTLVYGEGFEVPIERITLEDGKIVFHGRRHFDALEAFTTQGLIVYDPDGMVVCAQPGLVFAHDDAVRNGDLIVSQPFSAMG